MTPPKPAPRQPDPAPPRSARRRFILGGLLGSSALLVGWGFQPPRQRLHTAEPLPVAQGAVALNGWVTVGVDGAVAVVVPRSEMGQGVHTALPMLVAEELDVPMEAVRIAPAPIDKIFANVAVVRSNHPFHPDDADSVVQGAQWMLAKIGRELGIMFTGGSSSVRDAWTPMREAGAVARAMLVKAACEAWGAQAPDCRTEAGFVIHKDGRRAAYGQLAARAAVLGADIGAGDVRLKEPREFRLIGRPVARVDSRAKVDGSARFGIDARVPGMVYAALKMPPVVGGKVAGFDAAQVRSMRGVLEVVDISSAVDGRAYPGVAVVAASWWQARLAAAALPVSWEESEHAHLSSEGVFDQLSLALELESGHVYHERGSQEVQGAMTVTAEYRAPYLAHATMEPVNCTAQVAHGKVRLWASTQVPSLAVDIAASVAGVAREQVQIEVMLLGGGFGRRLEVDMVAQAVALAASPQLKGRPVQLIWTREDDTTHDFYRPAALSRFRAQLDAEGNILAWDNKSAGGAIAHHYLPRALGLPGVGPDKTTAEGAFDHQYTIANQRVAHVTVDSALPIGNWRSVGHSQNAFFKESFIEELAHAARRDSVDLRRSLLRDAPRALAVLDAAVRHAGQPEEGRAHGVALHRSYGSTVAQVAEVSVEGSEIRVHRVVCAIDCGIAVNPNIVAQQMESSVVFGLSAALGGEITVQGGRVQQSNFGDYPVLRTNQAPQVETIVMPSAEHPEGVGEPAVPPLAPAVAAAVFKLTGQRLRSLPLRLS
jgi:isoquinoline 1-oxidoreductase beta subunit